MPLPFALPYQTVVPFWTMDQRQEQCNHVLGHAVGAILRHVRDRNALSAGTRHIDDVVPGSQDGNEPQRRQCGQDRPVEWGLVGEDNFRPSDTTDDLVHGRPVVDGQFAQCFDGIPRVVARVERISVQNDDLHRQLRCGRGQESFLPGDYTLPESVRNPGQLALGRHIGKLRPPGYSGSPEG